MGNADLPRMLWSNSTNAARNSHLPGGACWQFDHGGEEDVYRPVKS